MDIADRQATFLLAEYSALRAKQDWQGKRGEMLFLASLVLTTVVSIAAAGTSTVTRALALVLILPPIQIGMAVRALVQHRESWRIGEFIEGPQRQAIARTFGPLPDVSWEVFKLNTVRRLRYSAQREVFTQQYVFLLSALAASIVVMSNSQPGDCVHLMATTELCGTMIYVVRLWRFSPRASLDAAIASTLAHLRTGDVE